MGGLNVEPKGFIMLVTHTNHLWETSRVNKGKSEDMSLYYMAFYCLIIKKGEGGWQEGWLLKALANRTLVYKQSFFNSRDF